MHLPVIWDIIYWLDYVYLVIQFKLQFTQLLLANLHVQCLDYIQLELLVFHALVLLLLVTLLAQLKDMYLLEILASVVRLEL